MVRPKDFLEAANWPPMLRCTELLSLQSALNQFFGEVLFGVCPLEAQRTW